MAGRKKKQESTGELFPMSAEERLARSKKAKAEYFESKQQLDDAEEELSKAKADHKAAAERHDVAKEALVQIALEESPE